MKRLIQEHMPIKWRLAVLMADREVDYKELAVMTGLHHVTISRHKNMRVMPERLERDTLLKYCQALKCQPGDLLVYVPESPSSENKQ
jgi:putative transcriptional regulator